MDQKERQEIGISRRYEPVLIQSSIDGVVLGFGVYDYDQGRVRDFPIMEHLDEARDKIDSIDPYGIA